MHAQIRADRTPQQILDYTSRAFTAGSGISTCEPRSPLRGPKHGKAHGALTQNLKEKVIFWKRQKTYVCAKNEADAFLIFLMRTLNYFPRAYLFVRSFIHSLIHFSTPALLEPRIRVCIILPSG